MHTTQTLRTDQQQVIAFEHHLDYTIVFVRVPVDLSTDSSHWRTKWDRRRYGYLKDLRDKSARINQLSPTDELRRAGEVRKIGRVRDF